jgi:mono/diheme cytochrome c family protein
MGITNELFQNERETDPNCQFNATPESPTPLVSADTASPSANFQSDIDLFSGFMRLLAAPTPASSTPASPASTPVASAASGGASTTTGASEAMGATVMASAAADVSSVLPAAAGSSASSPSATSSSAASVTRGGQVFTNVGCQACHSISLTTAKSPLTGQSNVTFQPFSDFAVHDMGSGLADGVTQGSANGNEFRSAPLWGVGQRIFLLHDGRTKDLGVAIQQHASRGSEANTVINNYNMLSRNDKQSLLNYLRSL